MNKIFFESYSHQKQNSLLMRNRIISLRNLSLLSYHLKLARYIFFLNLEYHKHKQKRKPLRQIAWTKNSKQVFHFLKKILSPHIKFVCTIVNHAFMYVVLL